MHLTHWTISFAFAGKKEKRKKVQGLAVKYMQENVKMIQDPANATVTGLNDIEFFLNEVVAGRGEFDSPRGTMWTIGRFSNYSEWKGILDCLLPFFRQLWDQDILDKDYDRVVMLYEEQDGEGLVILSLGYDGEPTKQIVGFGWGLR